MSYSFTFWAIDLRTDKVIYRPALTIYPESGMFEYNTACVGSFDKEPSPA